MITDEEAARIISRSRTNTVCRGLPGTDRCTHSLSGAGFPAAEVGDERWRKHWLDQPMRHHVYTWNPQNMPPPSEQQCMCGSTEKARIHQACWVEGWTDGGASWPASGRAQNVNGESVIPEPFASKIEEMIKAKFMSIEELEEKL